MMPSYGLSSCQDVVSGEGLQLHRCLSGLEIYSSHVAENTTCCTLQLFFHDAVVWFEFLDKRLCQILAFSRLPVVEGWRHKTLYWHVVHVEHEATLACNNDALRWTSVPKRSSRGSGSVKPFAAASATTSEKGLPVALITLKMYDKVPLKIPSTKLISSPVFLK